MNDDGKSALEEESSGARDPEAVLPAVIDRLPTLEEPPRVPEGLPMVPARSLVVFPGIILRMAVGRPTTKRMLEESLPHGKMIGIFAQRDPDEEEPAPEGLHHPQAR